ncbi:hypothetical protein COO60DRAFT_1509520 [Scenedesmus sp. NREL 46B-D3]|nr:hypothetical protein COO60DRAFT_1509520 [Scenedesmus sp. NREL 46B-D3]
MARLSALNFVGVAAIGLLAAVSAALALQGLATGTAHSVPALPQWELLGPTRSTQLQALTAVLPGLHPLMPLVQPYSDERMRWVIALALAVSVVIYCTLSVGAVMAFGTAVEVNVMNNMSVLGLEPLVGPGLARLLSWSIRGGYLISLLASLLLYMHPLRGCLAEVLWPEDATPVHTHSAAAPAAGSRTADSAGSGAPRRTSASPSAVPGLQQQQQQQQQQDHNPIDDSRVLLSFDSMDSPAFGSWQPGFIFRRPSASRSGSATPTASAPYPRARLGAGSGTSSRAVTPGAPAAGTAYSSAAAADGDGAGQQGLARWQRQEQRWYYLLTYGLLGGMVLVAVSASNIWEVLSAVGDLASTIQAFVVPGLIALVLAAWSRKAAAAAAATAAGQQRESVSPQAGSGAEAPKPASDGSSSSARGRGCGCKLLLQLRCDEPMMQELLLRAVHYVGGSLVVVLGLALFANGVYQRV